MKRWSALALGVIVSLYAAPQSMAAVQFPVKNSRASTDQVCVYKDINYNGAEQCYAVGDEINSLGAQRKSISSIRVYGRASVTVYENTSFQGHSAEFTSDTPDLGRRVMSGNTMWSDHIDSLRIGGVAASTTNSSGDNRRNSQDFPSEGVCVYERPNYEGRSQCWNQDQNISNLATQGNWNGQISSIRLLGRATATAYQEIDFRGERLTVDRSIPDLAAIRETGNGSGNGNGNGNNGRGRGRGRANGQRFENWDHQISSLQIQSDRRNR
jgi:hypothetical protein